MTGDELPPGAEPEAPQGDLPPGAEAEAPNGAAPVPAASGPAYTVNRTKEENQAQDLATSNAFTADSIRYIAESDKVAPDVRADSIRLSAAYGVPARTVEPNIQAFRDREAADKIDWPKVIEKVPALGRYLRSRPEAIALFKEPGEVDALHGMAWGTVGDWSADGPPGSDGKVRSYDGGDRLNALDKPSQRAGHWVPPMWYAAIAEGLRAAKSGAILANDYFERGLIEIDPKARAQLDAYDREHPGAADVRDALTKQARLEAQAGVVPHDYAAAVGEVDPEKKQTLHAVAEGLRHSAWMRLPSTKYAADLADWAGENFGAKRLLARAFQAPFKMAPMIAGTVVAGGAGTLAAGPVGGVVAGGLFLGEQNLETAHDAVEAASPGGKITPGGRGLAAGASLAGGMVQSLGFGPIANRLVGDAGTVVIKQIFTAAAKQGVKPTAAGIVGGILANAGKHAALGAASNGVQAGINESAAQVAAGELSVSRIATKSLDATMSSIGDMALLSGLGAGRELLADHGKAHAQASEAVQYTAAIEAAKASKLIKRSPEVAKQVLNATGGKIHIAAEDWTSYFQSQKIDPEKAATKVLGDDGAAYRSAAASGGDLTIPAGDFLAEFANTPHAEGLAKDVRLNSDSISAKMVERRTKEVEEHVKAEMKRRAPEIDEGKKQVNDLIEKQARAAGYSAEEAKAAAEFVAETAGTAAARLGSSVQVAAATLGLHELRISGEKGARLAEAARAEFMKFVTPEASKILKDRLATLTPEARARELYLDPVTGLQNGRAFEETPVPEGQQVGRIAIARVKGINDHANGGHNKANEYYRAVGAALHELAPDASYKVGGDFAVHVADEGQLKDIVDEVNRRIGEIHPELKAAGAIGASAVSAENALKTLKDKMLEQGTFPERTAPFPGDAGALKFPEGKATAEPAAHLHQAAAALTDEKFFQKAYLDTGSKTGEQTGILSREAWEALPRKANVAAVDLRGIRLANEHFGKDAGNRLIEAFSRWAAHLGGGDFDLAHLSGDEYAAQHHDSAALDAFMAKLQDVLKGVTFEVTDSVTGKKTDVYPRFRHGVGPDYDSADRAANAKRAEEGAADPAGRAAGAPERPEVPDRHGGARPQDFPGGQGPGDQEVAADRAWAFLSRGEHGDNTALKKLVDEARSRAIAEGKGKIDPKLAERATKAQGELDRLAARAGKRPAYVELPDGTLRAAEIPSWLKPEEFRENRSAWEWTRSAIDAASTKKIDKVEPPEPLQRLIAHYMEEGLAGFPDLNEDAIKRGYAVARLLAGHGGEAMAPRREQLLAWAKEPAATRAENPISDENWRRVVAFTAVDKIVQSNARGFQWDKKVDAVNRWLYSTKAELNPERPDYSSRPPAIYGETLTQTQATEREAAPNDSTGKVEAKRAEVAALNEQAAASVSVKPQPKLDFEKTTALAGAKSKHFERYTEQGGTDPAKVAAALGFKDPAEMVSAMVARREGVTPVAHLDGATVVLDQPPGKEGGAPRGEIRIIFGGGKMVKAEIPKLLGGDKSTMLHEMGHFLSWGFHNFAESDLATPQIRADYAALLKWAGYESPEHRYAERGTEASRAKEEKFSHAWEQYVAEGRAPAKPLVRVFNRMKGWMIQIYKGIKGVEDQYQDKYKAPLALTDEVRGIFDRLLATDDAINDARQRVGAGQADPAAVAAMSPDDHTAYLAALGRSRLAGDEETTRRAKQILDDQVGPERDLVRTQVAAELDKLPVHRATRFLQSGEWVGADGPISGKDLPDWLKDSKGQPLKLNRPDFVAKYGKDASAAAPRGVFAKGKGGTKADELAPRLGFDSGEALAKALGSGEHRDQALARQTQERVDAMFGSARQLLGDVAMEGVHNEHELEARLIEHRALSATVDPAAAKRARTLDPATLKRTVAGLIDDTKVSDLDPARYERADRKAALLAAKLQGAGDGKGAAQAREQRILNFELYRQARDRADGLDKAKARLERGADDVARARLGKADPAYRDVHDRILEALGLAEPEQGQRETVDSLVSTVTEKGARLDFDPAALREFIAHPKPWEDLTATEARMVSDAADNIRALARFDTEVNIAGKSATRIAKVEELKAAMAKNRKPASFPTPVKRSDPNLLEEAAHIARTAGAMLQDNKAWAVKIDGEGNIDGVGHQLFVDAFIGPRDKAVALTKKVLEPIVEAWKELPKEIKALRDQKLDLSGVLPLSEKVLGADRRDNRTRADLWMLFLNWGNEGNRQRVRDGNGHTDQRVREALDFLEKPELDFLQKVLDQVDSGLYAELAELHERDTGLKLGKVEATPIDTRHGIYRGGYFPLKYDPRFSEPGGKQEIQTLKDLESPAWVRPSSKTGATIERLDRVKGAPVDMEWGVIGNHLAGVVHDIAYREAIRNVGSILLDKDFKSAANDYLGPEYTQAFLPWLQGVATNRADLMSKNVLGAEVSGLARNVVAMGALGFNVSSVLAHSLDFSHAIAAGTRPEYIAAGMAKVIGYRFGGGWDKMREAALNASAELRYRAAARDGGFKKDLADMAKAPNSVRRGIQTAAFKMHELSEITQETAVFLGRQAQELAAGKSIEEATKIADDVVRQLLPSPDVASKPPILRTKAGLGAVTMFYGYANKLYNLYLARPVDRTVQAYRNPATGDRVAATAALAGKLMAMAILGASTKWVRGAGRKKDDDESVAEFMTKQLALEPAGTVPVLGPIIDSFVTGRKIDIRSAPEAEFAKGVAERLAAAYKHFSEGEESDAYEKFLSAAELAVDIGAGTHVGQASKTADYLKKAHSGEVEPRGAGDWIGGLLFGDHKGDPANPATAAQDWVSGK